MVPTSRARYDVPVAGLDEASARSVLAVMQDRLARDPASALGVSAQATPEEVRASFLALTKLFHPVRFGRMAVDIQKQSNEVFLALRAAHEALSKAARRATGPLPVHRVPGVGSGPVSQNSAPRVEPAKPARPPGTPLPSTSPVAQAGRPLAPRTPATAPSGGAPTARLANPARQSGGHAVVPPTDEAGVIELLSRQQWEPAKTALHQLLAREPGSKRVRALMCYARGREAQLDRRVDDARVELQDALDLDPSLQLAKDALTELFTRRK